MWNAAFKPPLQRSIDVLALVRLSHLLQLSAAMVARPRKTLDYATREEQFRSLLAGLAGV